MFPSKQKTSDSTKTPSTKQSQSITYPSEPTQNVKKSKTSTKVTIKYDVGFSNNLYVRGKGANLSWDRGVPLKNTRADEWVWETDAPFSECDFKVLINDQNYEQGENHHINQGGQLTYTPNF